MLHPLDVSLASQTQQALTSAPDLLPLHGIFQRSKRQLSPTSGPLHWLLLLPGTPYVCTSPRLPASLPIFNSNPPPPAVLTSLILLYFFYFSIAFTTVNILCNVLVSYPYNLLSVFPSCELHEGRTVYSALFTDISPEVQPGIWQSH